VKTVFWGGLYVLSLVVHLSWFFVGMFTAEAVGIEQVWLMFVANVATWIVIVVLGSGCPFSYLHQWLELKAGWRSEITYKYEDSIVYNLIINPIQQMLKHAIK